MRLARWGRSEPERAPVLWMVHSLPKSVSHTGHKGFSKTFFHSIHSVPCLMRQWKQLLATWKMANPKLHKLHGYLKQVFNCFVALNLAINISASAVGFVIAIHGKSGFLYSPDNLSPIFALTGVNGSFIIALSYYLNVIEIHEKRPRDANQLKDVLSKFGSNPGSKMRPYKGLPSVPPFYKHPCLISLWLLKNPVFSYLWLIGRDSLHL